MMNVGFKDQNELIGWCLIITCCHHPLVLSRELLFTCQTRIFTFNNGGSLIHLLSVRKHLFLLRVPGGAGLHPRQEYSSYLHTHTWRNLEYLFNLMCKFLDRGRNLEHLDKHGARANSI